MDRKFNLREKNPELPQKKHTPRALFYPPSRSNMSSSSSVDDTLGTPSSRASRRASTDLSEQRSPKRRRTTISRLVDIGSAADLDAQLNSVLTTHWPLSILYEIFLFASIDDVYMSFNRVNRDWRRASLNPCLIRYRFLWYFGYPVPPHKEMMLIGAKSDNELLECIRCSYQNSDRYLDRQKEQHKREKENHFRVLSRLRVENDNGINTWNGLETMGETFIKLQRSDFLKQKIEKCASARVRVMTMASYFVFGQSTPIFTIDDPTGKRIQLFSHFLDNNRLFVPHYNSVPSKVSYTRFSCYQSEAHYDIKAVFMSSITGYWDSVQFQIQLIPGDANEAIAKATLFNNAKVVFEVESDSGDESFKVYEEQMQVIRHTILGDAKNSSFDTLILQFFISIMFDGTDVDMCVNWNKLFRLLIKNLDQHMIQLEPEVLDTDNESEEPAATDRITRSAARKLLAQSSSASTAPPPPTKKRQRETVVDQKDLIRQMKRERGVAHVIPLQEVDLSSDRPRLRPRANIRKFSNYGP